jgi:hypothetical protein
MEDTTAALPITAATLITAGTPTTAAPIMAVIRTVRTAIATLTDTGPTIMARVIRRTITGASIAVPADQPLRACKNGLPVLDITAAQSMA